jgi:hypothetical protein
VKLCKLQKSSINPGARRRIYSPSSFISTRSTVAHTPQATMPLGILDDNKLEHVPGTAPLSELNRIDVEVAGADRSFLKHDASGEIVLVPQPSDSPNDPYNWPRWKKEMFTLVIAYGCGCVGGKSFASPSTRSC